MDAKLQTLIDNFTYTEDLGFGKTMAPVMMEMLFENGKWSSAQMIPYGPLQIDPAAKVLHYAQEIFEGMKAYKNENGEVTLFRPDMNAKRFNLSAKRMAMPEVEEQEFLNCCLVLTKALAKHVPSGKGQSLYLRPFMIATEPTLGVKASSTYAFYVIACLVESYFPRPSVRVYVEEKDCRAAPGGVGSAKTGANYGASLMAYQKTQKEGFDQTLWLDAINKRYVEELSGMNFFAIIGDELVTPSLNDTILAGITRDSILKMANEFGFKPVERRIDINELVKQVESGECSEAFACGTASVIAPIENLGYQNRIYPLAKKEDLNSLLIKERLLELQRNQGPDPYQWVVKVN